MEYKYADITERIIGAAMTVHSVLGNGFVVEEVKSSDGNPSKYGWDFTRGNVTVNIGLFPHKKNSNLNWIGLAVSVFEDEEILAKKTN